MSDKSDMSDKMVLVRREMLFGRAKALERAKAPWCGKQRCLVSALGADYGVGSCRAASRDSWCRLWAQITALSPSNAAKRPQTTSPQFDHGGCIASQGRRAIKERQGSWTCVRDRSPRGRLPKRLTARRRRTYLTRDTYFSSARRRRTSLTQRRLIQMAQRGCRADCSGCGWRCSRMRSGSLPVRVRLCTLL